MSQETHGIADQVSALILAGGRSSRMQGLDKGLVELNGQAMISHVLASLEKQLKLIRINANRNQPAYAGFGYSVVEDRLDDFQGPLAGMSRGLEECPTPWLLVVPCDTPYLPDDLVERLFKAATEQNAELAVVHDGKRMQPVISLLNRDLYPSLMEFLTSGDRKIDRWYAKHHTVEVDFSDYPDAFINVNSIADKQQLEEQELTRAG
ncbi:MAG: molybdenum cofactor guanylyltransferase [Motiliproteus sp.]|nr:molybdenum cofactor guanylyltransferase [Motiliproteus sp.]MCW9053842.1 molybdenum cofactor guanylyltransferase [Motiliproteus sp.]